MKQANVKIDCEYLTRINGRLCRVRVTGKRVVEKTATRKASTVFDWTRVNPPAGARVLRGHDTAASLRPSTGALQPVADLIAYAESE